MDYSAFGVNIVVRLNQMSKGIEHESEQFVPDKQHDARFQKEFLQANFAGVGGE